MKLNNPIYRKDLGKQDYTEHNPVSPDEFLKEKFNAVLDHPVYIDGNIHRFTPNGSKDKDGWYVFSEVDGIVFGKAGDWRLGKDHDERYSPEGKISEETLSRMAEKQREIEEERLQRKKSALARLTSEWDILPRCTNHPYLEKKKVQVHGDIRMTDKYMVIPMYDSEGNLINRQAISNDSSKRFGAFLETTGARYVIEGSGATFLCEGYATGASIFEATGATVVVCFSANNLKNVSKDYPNATVVADNDISQTGEKEAIKTGLKYILIPEEGMDANDYATTYGKESLSTLLLQGRPPKKRWLMSFSEWSRMQKPAEWLIKGYVPKGKGTSMIFGPSGCGKTFISIDMMLCIVTGTQWHGMKTRKASVAYFCGEGQSGIPGRVDAWLLAHGYSLDDKDEILKDFYISDGSKDLNDPFDTRELHEELAAMERKFDLIFIDTLNRYFSGDENKADDIHAFLAECEKIESVVEGVHIMIVHHTGIASEKENRARGNSALRGAMQVELMVLKNPDTGQILLKQTKQKDIELMPDAFFTLKRVDLPYLDNDGEQIYSVVPQCDGEERQPVDFNSIRANLLLRKAVKDSFEAKSEEVSIDPDDGKTILSSSLLISVAKFFYENAGMEVPYDEEYNLIKPGYKQSFVAMYLGDKIEKYAKGWWKIV